MIKKFSVIEVAEILGINRITLYSRINRGTIKKAKVDGHYTWTAEEVRKLVLKEKKR